MFKFILAFFFEGRFGLIDLFELISDWFQRHFDPFHGPIFKIFFFFFISFKFLF